ncbi:MAG TPA: acylphosphatase [Patescibacteria group bacterium]|nr:acylphosphatase [Patescibacteria group bacterium]
MSTEPSPAGGAAPPPARLEATVRGRVQGVGFRYFVVRRAIELGLVGWVANAADGSVRCVAEGPPEGLDAMASALGSGPLGAVVDIVDVVRMPGTGRFERFSVRSGAHSGD